jgi:hypothetical protein
MRFVPALLAFTNGDVWRPGIGDPTVMGWLTVVAYFAVAALCIRCAIKAPPEPRRRGTVVFWGGLGALLLLLGVNKQLDLQTWLTLTARRIAIAQGWYENRRPVQMLFVVLVGLAGAAGFAFMWRLVRAHSRKLWLSLLGFVLLLVFVIMRAASFHHMDAVINFRFAGLRMNWVLELGAIGLIALGTRQQRRGQDQAGVHIGSASKAAIS